MTDSVDDFLSDGDRASLRILRLMAQAVGVDPDDYRDMLDDEPSGPPRFEAVENIRAGDEVVIDLDLGLAARPFDADR